MSKTSITARMHPDGSLLRVLPDGTETAMVRTAPTLMSDAAIQEAARNDLDVQPLNSDLCGLRPIPRAKTLRRALGLTQEEFAARYQIALGTLRDWEQGRSDPDQTARAYLKAIAGDPVAIERALLVTSLHKSAGG